MNKSTWIIIGLVLVAFMGVFGATMMNKGNGIDYSKYDENTIIVADDNTGGLSENVKGGGAEAPVLIFEYADYQCPGCASTNPYMNEILEKYGDKVGLVFRSYLLSYHQNGRAAAAAANAAALQGYWKEYADLVFANQSEREAAKGSDRTDLFVKYFNTASKGAGDVEKFKQDMTSEAVAKKIDFDIAMGEKIDVQGTPAYYIDGELVVWKDATTKDGFIKIFSDIVDKKLAEKGL